MMTQMNTNKDTTTLVYGLGSCNTEAEKPSIKCHKNWKNLPKRRTHKTAFLLTNKVTRPQTVLCRLCKLDRKYEMTTTSLVTESFLRERSERVECMCGFIVFSLFHIRDHLYARDEREKWQDLQRAIWPNCVYD